MDNETRVKLAQMGLGMGFNCIRRSNDLLDLQLNPAASPILQLTMGTGFRAFKTDITDWYKLHRELKSSLTSPSASPVKIDFGMNVSRKSESRMLHRCEGYVVHTRTIRFALGNRKSDQNWRESLSPASAARPEDELHGVETGNSRYLDPERSRLESLLYTRSRTEKPTGEKQRVKFCRDLIEKENRGATHFISAIDLGAQIYTTKRVVFTETSSDFKIRGALEALSHVGGSVGFSVEHLKQAASSDSRVTANVHPDVEMKEAKTAIKPEQEKVIGYEVSPVWLLVRDPIWRWTMKDACDRYINKVVADSRPVICSGGPFLLATGKYFLAVAGNTDSCTGGIIVGTETKEKASHFYVNIPRYQGGSSQEDNDPVQDPQSGFYIYYKQKRGKLFLSADCKKETDLRLVTSIPSPNALGRFFVEFPSTRRLAPVSRWANDSLHLLRKTAYMKRNQYVVMRAKSNDKQLFFSSAQGLDDDPNALCQFTIHIPEVEDDCENSEEH